MVCAYTWILTQLTTSSAFSNARKYFLLFRCVALLVAVISSHFFATVIFFHFFCRFFFVASFLLLFLFRVFISFASFRFISGIVSNGNGVRMYDFNASITMIEFFFSFTARLFPFFCDYKTSQFLLSEHTWSLIIFRQL